MQHSDLYSTCVDLPPTNVFIGLHALVKLKFVSQLKFFTVWLPYTSQCKLIASYLCTCLHEISTCMNLQADLQSHLVIHSKSVHKFWFCKHHLMSLFGQRFRPNTNHFINLEHCLGFLTTFVKLNYLVSTDYLALTHSLTKFTLCNPLLIFSTIVIRARLFKAGLS